MPEVRTSFSVSQNLGKDQTLPEEWNPKSNLHWICLMGDIVWFLKYKESWKSSVLYIARGSQATNREGCGCPDIHWLNSSYHWASNLTLKCCAKESLLDVQAFIRNIEKEVLKEICFHYVSDLFPWVIYFIYCFENQVTAFSFVLFSGSWMRCLNLILLPILWINAVQWGLGNAGIFILRYLWADWSYHLSCFIISESQWRVGGKQEKSSLKREEGISNRARKARELCLKYCKLNFYPWKNSVMNKQTKNL